MPHHRRRRRSLDGSPGAAHRAVSWVASVRSCVFAGFCLSALLPIAGCGSSAVRFERFTRAGLERYEAERFPEALAMFEQAAAADRERPEPAYYMGRCYLAMARRQFEGNRLIRALHFCDRAISSFDDAIGAFPGFGRAVRGKAEALRLQGRHAAAMEIANWAAEHSGARAKKLILKAHLLAEAGDMDQAQLAFKQATSVGPEDAATHAELGLFYLRCGNEPAAVRSLKRAYELDPGAPGVVTALAHLGALADASEQD